MLLPTIKTHSKKKKKKRKLKKVQLKTYNYNDKVSLRYLLEQDPCLQDIFHKNCNKHTVK